MRPFAKKPGDIFDYEAEDHHKLMSVKSKLEGASDEYLEELARKALEEMEDDSKPFVRILVRRSEAGELIPPGASASEVVLKRIADMLEGQPEPA